MSAGNKSNQNNNNSPGLDTYIQKGCEVDIGTTKYVIIKNQGGNTLFFEWFKYDTPAYLLYNFVNLIDPKIANFELYKSYKTESQKIDKNDKRKLKDIFSTHIAEVELRFRQ